MPSAVLALDPETPLTLSDIRMALIMDARAPIAELVGVDVRAWVARADVRMPGLRSILLMPLQLMTFLLFFARRC